MFAKVSTAFNGRPDNEAISRTVLVGEVISGDLAVVAVRENWASEVPPNAKSDAALVDAPDKSELRKELEGKTVVELKALAAEKAVELGGATLKADIVELLEKALAAPAA